MLVFQYLLVCSSHTRCKHKVEFCVGFWKQFKNYSSPLRTSSIWETPLMPGNDTRPLPKESYCLGVCPHTGAQTNINFGTTQLWNIYVSFFFFKDKKHWDCVELSFWDLRFLVLCLRVKSKKKRVLFAVLLLLYHALKKSLPKSF